MTKGEKSFKAVVVNIKALSSFLLLHDGSFTITASNNLLPSAVIADTLVLAPRHLCRQRTMVGSFAATAIKDAAD